jgi:hypothetical protein
MGLTKEQYWNKYVHSKSDIEKFYKLFYPEYPPILATSIAQRISDIIDKSRNGEQLTEEEQGYVIRSKQKDDMHWDYEEELKQQEMAGKINVTMKRLD